MNKNFYNYAKNLIKNMSLDELQDRLQSFGIECERIDGEVAPGSILNGDIAVVPSAVTMDFNFQDLMFVTAIDAAVNDNSYALAA